MKTKQICYPLLALLILAAIPSRLQASHGPGVALTYTHLSGSMYRFQCTLYRECTSAWSQSTVSIHITSISCNVDEFATLYLDTSQGSTITITCPYSSTNCDTGMVQGVEKLVYTNDILLNGQCPDWLFELSDCCRNAAITTLINAGGDGIYVPARLNNSMFDNSSPQFTNDPIAFACNDQDFHFNHGMFDPDGDSISYHLIGPRTAANTYAVYSPGYSVSNPLSSDTPVTFHEFTGDLFIRSTAIEVAVMVYEIKDWRNGELMGVVTQDVMLYTYPCGTSYPTATGMNGTSQQFLYVFPDDTVCFDVFSDDPDVSDTVTMTWNQTIPGATFVTNGVPHPTGTFCWTPTINDVRSQPYMFTVMVNDNHCPVVGACIYSYFIYVTLDSSLVWAGINNPENIYSISPNPTKGPVTIQSSEKILHVKIFNDKGTCIRNGRKEDVTDISDEPAGIYFVEIISAKGNRTVNKLIKE